MTADTDSRLEQTILRRRLWRWRVFAFVFFTISLAIYGKHVSDKSAAPHLARFRISGVIMADYAKQVRALMKVASDKSVKALILEVDSPGGAVTAGEMIHNAVEAVAKKKPVVVTMGTVAASAGYMISVPAQRIFAGSTTLTGSIGVIMQSPDLAALLDGIGVRMEQLVSGPLKGQPSYFQHLSPQGRDVLQGIVADLYDQFVNMVAQGRHMPPARVRELADGRPYTGRQALKLGLIDQIGNEDDARAWLEKEKHISKSLPVKTVKAETAQKGWLSRMSGYLGIITDAGKLHSDVIKSLTLDGAVSLWNP